MLRRNKLGFACRDTGNDARAVLLIPCCHFAVCSFDLAGMFLSPAAPRRGSFALLLIKTRLVTRTLVSVGRRYKSRLLKR